MARSKQSRKGKKAWVKNVDVEDVNAALDQKREKEILLGGDDNDFVIDTEGDRTAKRQKVLKTTEILRNKSKVPAQSQRVRKQVVLKKRASELMALTGRLLADSKFKKTVERDGILRADAADLWSEETKEEPKVPVIDPHQSSIPYSAPLKAPSTIKEAPLLLRNTTSSGLKDFEHGGKSYNPALDDWKKLIDHEFGNESTLELKRQAAEAHQKRIEHLIQTLEDEEVQDLDEANDDDEQEETNEEDKYKLSVNPRTEIKTKTRTQRNKEERHKKTEALYSKLRDVKKKIAEISRLEDIEAEVEEKLANKKEPIAKDFVRHGKHDVTFNPIEVKLSDELTGNLRSLRPEGNLLYDSMHKLQMQGKVESRVPFSGKKKQSQKFVEKRSFRDP